MVLFTIKLKMFFWCGPIAFYVVLVWSLDRIKTELTLPKPNPHISLAMRGCSFGKAKSVLVRSCVVFMMFIFFPSVFGAVLCAFGVVLCDFGAVRRQRFSYGPEFGCGKVHSRIW